MKLERCANGHFYDGDLYSSCPHCAAGIPNSPVGNDVTVPVNSPTTNNYAWQDVTVPATMSGASEGIKIGYGGNEGEETTVAMPINNIPSGNTSDDEEVTIGYFSPDIHTNYSDPFSGDTLAQVEPHNPTVGWLICISGIHAGKDFQLHEGMNFIGRNDIGKNSIALSGDTSVSKEKHAIVAYDPVGNTFTAIIGSSASQYYLNGKPVYTPSELKKYDILTVGKEQLMFIPLCDDVFNWDKYLKK